MEYGGCPLHAGRFEASLLPRIDIGLVQCYSPQAAKTHRAVLISLVGVHLWNAAKEEGRSTSHSRPDRLFPQKVCGHEIAISTLDLGAKEQPRQPGKGIDSYLRVHRSHEPTRPNKLLQL